MRDYAAMLTGASTAMIALYCLIEFTQMEFFSMLFVSGMIGFFAVCIFAFVTEEPKPKAHWENEDGLDVMVMQTRRRRNGRK